MYPGMIEAYSHLGLVEISSTRSTIDMAETGSLNPNVSAHISVNPDSELIPVTRANGVLIAVSVPTGVKVILMGGHDAEMCAELLRRYDVPVIIDAVHKVPRRTHEEYDSAYTLPERLRRANIRFCISSAGRSESWNTRNLPYHAATAVAYGLPYDEALKSVTQYPAEILGIADRVGSLDVGKDATLFVSDGDPLETETQTTAAWIQGRKVDLSSRHTLLYDKYRIKYRQLKSQR